MVGSAVATIVWSRAARNMPIISPDMITRICRWLNPPGSSAITGAGAVTLEAAGARTSLSDLKPVLTVCPGRFPGRASTHGPSRGNTGEISRDDIRHVTCQARRHDPAG